MNKLAAMSVLSAILVLFGCDKREAGGDVWCIATGTENGFPLIVRFRNTVPQGVRPEDYPELITVGWNYNPRANGMPEAEDNSRLEELENLLDKCIESKRQGFMMMAETSNGRRQWQWYSRDQNEFNKLLSAAVLGKPPIPIEISYSVDREWAAYRTIQRRVKP
jgi:hypothetical protein